MPVQTKLGLLGGLLVVLGLCATWSWYFNVGPVDPSSVTFGPSNDDGVAIDSSTPSAPVLFDGEGSRQEAGVQLEPREAVSDSELGRAFLRGRLLRESGAPFANQEFMVQLFCSIKTSSFDSGSGRQVRYSDLPTLQLSGLATDESGDFKYELTNYLLALDSDQCARHGFQIIAHPMESELLRVELPRPEAFADIELGDLVVKRVPILIAGIVLDPKGQPVQGAKVYLRGGKESILPFHSRDQLVHMQSSQKTGTNGEFRFVGEGYAERYVALATHGDHESAFSEVVPKGTSDLVMNLTAKGSIVGLLRDTAAGFENRWDLAIVPAGLASGVNLDESSAIEGSQIRRNVAGDFELVDLLPGPYDLHIFDPESGAHRLSLNNLFVPVGQCADPRLQSINPLAGMPTIQVSVKGPNGEVPKLVLVSAKSPATSYSESGEPIDDSSWTTISFLRDGQGAFTLPHLESRLAFRTIGFATYEVSGVQGNLEIRLKRAIEVTASLRTPIDLDGPKGVWQLYIRLEPTFCDEPSGIYTLRENMQKVSGHSSSLKIGEVGTYKTTYYLSEGGEEPFLRAYKLSGDSPPITITRAGESIILDPPLESIRKHVGSK